MKWSLTHRVRLGELPTCFVSAGDRDVQIAWLLGLVVDRLGRVPLRQALLLQKLQSNQLSR